jgi:large conductance mechanosensitive channel
MKAFFKEFKEFIAKGNVLDMAVGVVVGSAFTAIVTSVVENLLTPIIGLLIPDTTFADWAPGGFGIGAVINSIITFLITAFVVFVIVKAVNKFKKPKEEEPAPDPEPSEEVLLLREIRDALKK